MNGKIKSGVRAVRPIEGLCFGVSAIKRFAYLDKSKDKKVTQRMIEIGLNNTNPTVTNIIKSMMSKNLIYKIQDKVDKRMYYLYLTPLALKIAPECVKRMEDTDKAAYKNLTEEELKTIRVLLEKLDF